MVSLIFACGVSSDNLIVYLSYLAPLVDAARERLDLSEGDAESPAGSKYGMGEYVFFIIKQHKGNGYAHYESIPSWAESRISAR